MELKQYELVDFHLFQNYGSVTSFNMEPSKFDFRNQPLSFYIPINGSLSTFFDNPIRGNFDNQLLPILYSDLWGDYWGYFSFTSKSLDTGRNQMLIGNYLGRVNLLSIFPTVLFVVAFLKLSKYKENQLIYKYFKIYPSNKLEKNREPIPTLSGYSVLTTTLLLITSPLTLNCKGLESK